MTNKKIDFKEYSYYINILKNFRTEKNLKLARTKEFIKFTDLDLTNISIKDNIDILKNNQDIIYYFNSCFYSTINYFGL